MMFGGRMQLRKQVLWNSMRQWRLRLAHVSRHQWRLFSDPAVSMVFDNIGSYGGLVDRLKGIVSGQHMAERSGRALHLFFDDRFPLHRVYDFQPPIRATHVSEFAWNLCGAAWLYERDRKRNLPNRVMSSRRHSVVLYTNLDYLPDFYPSLAESDVHRMWGLSFEKIFRPGPDLKGTLDQLPIQPDDIAIHARFTSLLGDFRDSTWKYLGEPKAEELVRSCLEVLGSIVVAHPGRRLWLFSDSRTFRSRVRTAFPEIGQLPNDPEHLDYSPKFGTLLSSLSDFYGIARCGQVFLLRLGDMYDSQFSRYASYLNSRSIFTRIESVTAFEHAVCEVK